MRVQNVSAGGGGGAVAERWITELRAGRCFSQGSVIGPVAGQNSHIQLLNPAGSGVTAIVYSLTPACITTATDAEMRRHDTALTTAIGNGTNLLVGGAAGQCQVRGQNNAGVLGSTVFWRLRLAAGVYQFVNWWSAELGEGEGILIALMTVNVANVCSFWWNEV